MHGIAPTLFCYASALRFSGTVYGDTYIDP